jgi:hypothetical protein
MKISIEQKKVVDALATCNVIVDAVAGSGKTTTCLHIAKTYKDKKILLITYNAKLRHETNHRLSKANITNLIAHTYHSFCVKYYDNTGFTDKTLKKVVLNNTSIKDPVAYDIIILDEAQDINPIYHKFVYKLNIDNGVNATLCILGDKYQSVYDFNKADYRFLTFADKLFTVNSLNWARITLSTSFRLTIEMSQFLNKCMLHQDRINAIKTGVKPKYIICKIFSKTPFNEVKELLTSGKYNPQDIFILAPSVKSNKTPVRQLENKIKRSLFIHGERVPIYTSNTDDEKIDEKMIKNKLVISTFHSVKGLERKVVLVFNFDDGYFKYYNTDANPEKCPNALYVAITRASERLILFHGEDKDYLPFLNKTNLPQYANVVGTCKYKNKEDKDKPSDIKTSVTNLCRHLPEDTIETCISHFTITNITPAGSAIRLRSTVHGPTTESVSDINGIAIVLYYEYLYTGKIKTISSLHNNENITQYTTFAKNKTVSEREQIFNNVKNNAVKKYLVSSIRNNIADRKLTAEELLYISNRWSTYIGGYLGKCKQIFKYNWMTQTTLDKCMENVKKLAIAKPIFEYPVEYLNDTVQIKGSVDCIDSSNMHVYEFKCVNKLSDEHYLQLAIYAYIIEKDLERENVVSNAKYYLYNILDGQLDEIQFDMTALDHMMKFLLVEKYSKKTSQPDEEFLSKNHITADMLGTLGAIIIDSDNECSTTTLDDIADMFDDIL